MLPPWSPKPHFLPLSLGPAGNPIASHQHGVLPSHFFKLHTSLSPLWSYFTPSPSLHPKAVWPKLSPAESRWELLPDASLALWRGSCRHRGTVAPQGSGICPVHNSHYPNATGCAPVLCFSHSEIRVKQNGLGWKDYLKII